MAGLAGRMPISNEFRQASALHGQMAMGKAALACAGRRKAQHDARAGHAGGLSAAPPPGRGGPG